MKKSTIAAAALVAATLASTGLARAEHLNIAVDGATVDGDAIVFPSVLIDMDGYVVVHAVQDGEPVLPASIGHVAVPAGTTENVSVPIEGGVEARAASEGT